ncbi:MAG: dihydrodipicolinate reductase [Verrucomicrobia bacterium]|nr:dihydrodipicolinate reductase [Prolixibacteraceae bacterium]
MKIFVVGSGKLANALLNSDLSIQDCEVIQWETSYADLQEKSIIVHAGSGRQVNECFEYCKRTQSAFIELSTGLQSEAMDDLGFPVIICPNTSVLVLKTLHMVKKSGGHFKNYEVSITESHQSAKTTEPGTAFAFAHSLNHPTDKIISVRDPELQGKKMGIPGEYLDKHAWHRIVIRDGNDEVSIETKVLGHDSYARGVKMIIQAILENRLENKRYTVLDLIDKNML